MRGNVSKAIVWRMAQSAHYGHQRPKGPYRHRRRPHSRNVLRRSRHRQQAPSLLALQIPFGDVFKLQAEVAEAIVKHVRLKVKVSPCGGCRSPEKVADRESGSTDAYLNDTR